MSIYDLDEFGNLKFNSFFNQNMLARHLLDQQQKTDTIIESNKAVSPIKKGEYASQHSHSSDTTFDGGEVLEESPCTLPSVSSSLSSMTEFLVTW